MDTTLETAISQFPLNDETKKQVEKIQRSPEFKIIIFNAIVTELKKETKTELEERASLNKAQALANLIIK